MHHRLSRMIIFLLLISFTSSAQKQIPVILPAKEFDIELAAKMLNEGTAEINGVSYYENRSLVGIKTGETIYGRLGTVVSLYPLTPYLEEYLSLKKKNRSGKKLVTISPLASSFRIESKIYSLKGEFIFKGLLPGKYYLGSIVHFPSGVGGAEVSGIVEITTDGEKAGYKLKHIY